MSAENALLVKAKQLIEEKMGWGPASEWTNQDFIALARKMQEATDLPISHVTLKRLWGKVRYESLPQANTLNTLAQFLGFSSWRDFASRHATDNAGRVEVHAGQQTKNKRIGLRLLLGASLAVLACVVVVFLIASGQKKVQPENYFFSARLTHPGRIPASVVFHYGTRGQQEDSLVIQQSWDSSLRARVSPRNKEHTLIYYYPGYFSSKLLAFNQVVKEQGILIPSDGWMAAIMHRPIPVYFNSKDIFQNGRLVVDKKQIATQNIALTPDAPQLSYLNVQDFGEIYTDDFAFETSLRSEYSEGASVCQMTNIYLLCQGGAIGIPLCAKGCESALNMFFTDFTLSGKEKDLSAFATDFQKDVKVKIVSQKGRAVIYVNNHVALRIDQGIAHLKIIGIDFVFQGTGSVDYVHLSNGKVNYRDDFTPQ